MRFYGSTIQKKIKQLRQDTVKISDEYLEKLYLRIKFYVNHLEEYDFSQKFWDKGLQEILNLIYEALENVYKKTSTNLKNTFEEISEYDLENIKDLIYIKDGKTLEDRVTLYWTEAKIRLENQENTNKVNYYLLQRDGIILNTETKNVEEAIIKNRKPIPPEGAYVIQVIEGCGSDCDHEECSEYNGEYPEDEDIPWPPYHPNCTGIGYWDFTDNPDDIEDLDLRN